MAVIKYDSTINLTKLNQGDVLDFGNNTQIQKTATGYSPLNGNPAPTGNPPTSASPTGDKQIATLPNSGSAPIIPAASNPGVITSDGATPSSSQSSSPAPTNGAPPPQPGIGIAGQAFTQPVPQAPSMESILSQSHIPTLQSYLSNIQQSQMQLQNSFKEYVLGINGKGTPQGIVDVLSNEQAKSMQIQMDTLNQAEAVASAQVSNAMTWVNMNMQAAGTDYQNATQAYNDQFNRAYQIQSMYNQTATQQQNNASAYLNTVANMVGQTGVNWANVSPSMKATIQAMETQAGWPAGTLQSFAQVKPGANILGTVNGVDPATGQNTTSFIYSGPDGKPGVINTIVLPSKPTTIFNSYGPTGGDGSTQNYSTSTGNNPLNLTLGSATQKYVDNGQATVSSANGLQFLVFKDPTVGLQASKDLLFNPKGAYANLTVDQAMKTWSNGGYGGEIVKGQGVDPAAKVSDLPPAQQQALVSAMAKAEGGKIASAGPAGTTGSPTVNTSLPGYSTKIVVGRLTQAAIDQAALVYATTEQLPAGSRSTTGIAGQENAAIKNRAAELGPGTNIAGNKATLAANSAALKTQTDYLNTTQRSLQNAENGMNQLITAFQGKVNDNSMPIANILANATKYQINPGDVAAYKAALAEVSNEYTQVFSRGGQVTDATRSRASDVINGNISISDLFKVAQELQAQGNIVITGAQTQIQSIQQSINGIIKSPDQTNSGSGNSGTTSSGVSWSVIP